MLGIIFADEKKGYFVMEMLSFLPVSLDYIIIIALIMMRVSVFLGMTTVLKKYIFTGRTLIAFSAVTAFCISSGYHSKVRFPTDDIFIFMQLSAAEIGNGLIFSFAMNVLFGIFGSAGQMISLWTGMSAAAFIDPSFGSITDVSKFFLLLSVVIFLLLGGHLQVILALAKSFEVFPPGRFVLSQMHGYMPFVKISFSIFSAGLLLSMPILVAMMLINFSMALATRLSPQVSIFSIGLPLLIIFGMLGLYLIYNLMITTSVSIISSSMGEITQWMRGRLYG